MGREDDESNAAININDYLGRIKTTIVRVIEIVVISMTELS